MYRERTGSTPEFLVDLLRDIANCRFEFFEVLIGPLAGQGSQSIALTLGPESKPFSQSVDDGLVERRTAALLLALQFRCHVGGQIANRQIAALAHSREAFYECITLESNVSPCALTYGGVICTATSVVASVALLSCMFSRGV